MGHHPVRIAILASGAGSNARNIIEHFRNNNDVVVALIASNKKDAGVLNIAAENDIPTSIITKENFRESDEFLQLLKASSIDAIILAGFLWKVPSSVVNAFQWKILNIHPALLPKYGGKGMYGHFVHDAVHAAKEKESGITIHFVNENYDEGDILLQVKATLDENDTPASIEKKVRELERIYFPRAIGRWIKDNF